MSGEKLCVLYIRGNELNLTALTGKQKGAAGFSCLWNGLVIGHTFGQKENVCLYYVEMGIQQGGFPCFYC